jgi:hypothetical protein
MYHLDREADPTDRTAVEAVVDHVMDEVQKLEKMADDIMAKSVREGYCKPYGNPLQGRRMVCGSYRGWCCRRLPS